MGTRKGACHSGGISSFQPKKMPSTPPRPTPDPSRPPPDGNRPDRPAEVPIDVALSVIDLAAFTGRLTPAHRSRLKSILMRGLAS